MPDKRGKQDNDGTDFTSQIHKDKTGSNKSAALRFMPVKFQNTDE